MFAGRGTRAIASCAAAVLCTVASLSLAGTAYAAGPANGSTISNAAQAQLPFAAGSFDSGQPLNVVVPANSVLTPYQKVFILECAAPGGVVPTTTASCDGNTGYNGGTILVNADGSVDMTGSSSSSGLPYTLYALPNLVSLGEPSTGSPRCGLSTVNACVLYIGQGGGGDTGFTQPHYFSQPFQVHADPTDSGTLTPGDGTADQADAAPAITSASSATFTQGSAGTFTVAATGYAAPTVSESGALPTGVTFNATTKVLSGTPSGFGTFHPTFSAANAIFPNATQSFTLTVRPSVSGEGIPGAAAAQNPHTVGTFDSGQPINVVVPANPVLTPNQKIYILECAAPGGALPTTTASCDGNTGYNGGTILVNADGSVDVTGGSSSSGNPYTIFALPDLVSLGENLTGSPKCGLNTGNACVLYIGQGGGGDTGFTQPHYFSQPFQVHADPTDSGTLTPGDGTADHVDVAPVITSASSATFTRGTAGTFTATATGYGPAYFAKSGALPTGVTFNTLTGVLSGTPMQAGVFNLTFTALNGVLPNASQAFTLTANGSPSLTSANNYTLTEPASPSFTVAASGYPAPTYSVTAGSIDGLSLNATSGALTGTPTATGVFTSTITAGNGVGTAATQSFTLTVNPATSAPTITSATGTSFLQGSPGTFTVAATGNPAPTLSESGSLSSGVVLSAAGVLSGIPTQAGVFPIAITASNGVGSPATQAFTLTVNPSGTAPTITSASSTSLTAGLAGTFTVTASGTPAPTFIDPGPLDGLTLDATTGVLSGTPTAAGTFTSTITASNGVASPATQSFTLTVNVPPFGISTSTDLPSAAPGATDPVTFTLVGATVGAKIKFKGAGFPKGLKVSSAGVLGGVISSKVHSGTVYHPMVTVTETVTTRVGKVKTKTLTVVAKAFNLTVS
jgi:hypothetical protein